jgi:hypothetical protein
LAAFAIASTSSFVMSACWTSIWATPPGYRRINMRFAPWGGGEPEQLGA